MGKGEQLSPEERDRLFKDYLPLAISRAKIFKWSGYSLGELASVAEMGLGEAVERFNPKKYNNGLAAYARLWIDGALKRFITNNQSIVGGIRKERGKFLPRASSVNHFGNAAIGDGEFHKDTSLADEIGGDNDNSDDEDGAGTLLDTFADHKLEAIRGDYFWERLEVHKRSSGTEHWLRLLAKKIGCACECWRWYWIGEAWLDNDAELFRRERIEYCKRGVGYLLRDRRTENKCRRIILPYEPPAWTVACEDKRPGCNCIGCRPTKLGPADDYQRQRERLRSFERIGFAPYEDANEVARSQDDWKDWKRWKRNEARKWKLKARKKHKWKLTERKKLKAEHAGLSWPDDNLSSYEIWSKPSYSAAFYAKGPVPYRLPFLMAQHDFYVPKNGTIKPDGSPERRTGRGLWSATIIGEGDCDLRSTTPCVVKWTSLGDSHKRRVAEVDQDIVLHKITRRFGAKSSCQSFICLKPDSKLVLLFWARHLIALHYSRYWMPLDMENEDENRNLQITRHAA
jgi:hypothetical protein